MFTAVNELAPKQLLPTAEQQVARVSVRKKLKRQRLWLVEDPESYRKRKEGWRRRKPRPNPPSFIECAALNVASKLANTAFGRYANGCDAKASRRIPGKMIIGDTTHDEFADMVEKYVRKLIRSGNRITVEHDSTRIYLRVIAREPATSKEQGWVKVVIL